jgi:hypothetical protein
VLVRSRAHGEDDTVARQKTDLDRDALAVLVELAQPVVPGCVLLARLLRVLVGKRSAVSRAEPYDLITAAFPCVAPSLKM